MSKLVANQISPRSGSDLTLNGNVSVGGTLTYNDVTNIDSVGLITARSGIDVLSNGVNVIGVSTFSTGIRVGAGQSISAVSGTLTYYGDGSNLTGAWEVRDTWLYGGG